MLYYIYLWIYLYLYLHVVTSICRISLFFWTSSVPQIPYLWIILKTRLAGLTALSLQVALIWLSIKLEVVIVNHYWLKRAVQLMFDLSLIFFMHILCFYPLFNFILLSLFLCFTCLEKKLHSLGLLSSHPNEQSYFRKDVNMGLVEDDHVPFLQRGKAKHPCRIISKFLLATLYVIVI